MTVGQISRMLIKSPSHMSATQLSGDLSERLHHTIFE